MHDSGKNKKRKRRQGGDLPELVPGMGLDLPGTVTCPSCKVVGKHRVTHIGDLNHHLRCQTCGAVRAYEGKTPSSSARLLDYEMLISRRGTQAPRPYRRADTFDDGQFIEHSSFGVGYVLAVRHPPDKMEVLFADRRRLLVCQHGVSRHRGPQPWVSAVETPSAVKTPSAAKTPSRARKRTAGRGRARPKADRAADGGTTASEAVDCPICGKRGHPYNLRRRPSGEIVGCLYCC